MYNIPFKYLLSYGIVAFPVAFAGIPIYLYAPDLYSTKYGVSLFFIGLALFILRLIDAILDPIIGILSDKFAQYREWIIFVAYGLLGLTFYGLFSPLFLFKGWFVLFVFLTTTFYSIVAINVNTLGGLWVDDKDIKTKIVATRELFTLLGLIVAFTLPSILQLFVSVEDSFFLLSILLLTVIVVVLPIFRYWSINNKQVYVNTQQQGVAVSFSFKQFIDIPAKIKYLFLVYAVSVLASTIPSVLLIFFVRDRLNLENYTGVFLLTYFLFAILALPFWNHISKKIGKLNTWQVSIVLAIVVFCGAFFLQAGNFFAYLLICLFSGVAFGAELVMPFAILSDYIFKYQQKNKSTFYFSIFTFLTKLALGVSSVIVFSALDFAGFVPNSVDNSYHALLLLSILYALVPCVIKLGAVVLLSKKLQ